MAIIMNTAIVLPPLMLGRAIDAVLAIERGEGDATTAGWAALSLVGAAALVEGSRVFKRLLADHGEPAHPRQPARRRPAWRAGLAGRAPAPDARSAI